MSFIPQLRKDFGDNTPSPTQEIESKINVATPRDLDRIKEELVRRIAGNTLSRQFYAENPEVFYTRDASEPYVLITHPVSIYLDDAKETLWHNGGSTLRARITPYLPGYIQLGVKSDAQEFDGPGGAIRHEHEMTVEKLEPVYAAGLLHNDKTRQALEPILKKRIYSHFATDVERRTLPFPVQVAGKNALFEICFDPITYLSPLGWDKRKSQWSDYSKESTIPFFELNQIEKEYFNPQSLKSEMAEFAGNLKLDILTYAEIEQAMAIVNRTVKEIAEHLGIGTYIFDVDKKNLTPEEQNFKKYTEPSKGDIGFMKQEEIFGGLRPFEELVPTNLMFG